MFLTGLSTIDRMSLKDVSERFKREHPDLKLTSDDVRQIENLYKSFLWLSYTYPKMSLAPAKIIDDYWHIHILDTQRYQQDCHEIFGFFLHHIPSGLRVAKTRLDDTVVLVKKHFPELI